MCQAEVVRATNFGRCFPTGSRFGPHDPLQITPNGGPDVFVLHEYAPHDRGRCRNADVLTVRDDRVVQELFGGRAGA